MDYLQYVVSVPSPQDILNCFKPYYKWITFNILNSGDYRIKEIMF